MKLLIATSAIIGLTACSYITPTAAPPPTTFPSVSQANAAKFNTTPCTANPTSQSENVRVGPVNLAAGFNGHVVKVCADETLVKNVIFWSRTNEAGTDIEVVVTTLAGTRIPQTAESSDRPSTTNYFSFEVVNAAGTLLSCTIIKPAPGISPAGLALCET